MKFFYVLSTANGSKMRSFPSRFEREIGDYMNIEGVKMRIISSGFHSIQEATAAMHATFNHVQQKSRTQVINFFK